MKVLFFPQSDTALENLRPVIKVLEASGVDAYILDGTCIYKKPITTKPNEKVDGRLADVCLDKSFYYVSLVEKLKIVYSVRHLFQSIAKSYDAFVFTNDGAFQRLIIRESHKLNKKSFLVLDGIISDYSYSLLDVFKYSSQKLPDILGLVSRQIRTIISKTFRKYSISSFLPSLLTTSTVDNIYAIGPHSKAVIRKNAYNKNNVFAYGLPKYKDYFEPFSGSCAANDKLTIAFLTSAFLWHDNQESDRHQHQDMELICAIIEKNKLEQAVTVIIKTHPRDRLQDYEKYKRYAFVKIIGAKDIKLVISESDLIFSNISTSIIEALLLKRETYSLMINFPYWKYKRSFVAQDCIPKVFSEAELAKLIVGRAGAFLEPAAGHEKQDVGKNIEYLFKYDNNNSAELIAADIINSIKSQR